MPMAQPLLLCYEDVPKFGLAAACCGGVAKVSAYHFKLWWSELVSAQSVQRCTIVWWNGRVEEATTEKMNKEGRKRRRQGEDQTVPVTGEIFYFVSIWQPSWILMSSQPRWSCHVNRFTIPVTALFSSGSHTIIYINEP